MIRAAEAAAILGAVCATAGHAQLGASDGEHIHTLKAQFEQFRKELKMPGMAVIILQGRKVVWKHSFGYADVATKRPYLSETPQHIASLTKTFAATLVLQLVERGELRLNEAVADYVPEVKDRRVQIRHLLSHTSEGVPGDEYRYSGARYDLLTTILEKKTGKSFRRLLIETFQRPLVMNETVPGQELLVDNVAADVGLNDAETARYRAILSRIALPHARYGDEVVVTAFPPQKIGAAAGLVSTVGDLAKFDVAIDEHRFLKPETQELAWTPFVSNSGKVLPHGLGWFAQTFAGEKLIWHYGHWPGMYSATYVKVPARNLTMILLANSEAASAGFYLTGGIETSPFACAFLKIFAWQGDDHGCESTSSASMNRWIEDKRAEVRQALVLPANVLRGYTGDYTLRGRDVAVTYKNGRLFISLPRNFPSELFPESRTRFFLKTADYEVTFVPGENGTAQRLNVYTASDKHEAERKH